MKSFILFFILIGFLIEANPSNSTPKIVVKPDNEIWVMVIDTGIGKHDKLTNVQYNETSDYIDTNGHGTHVAGIIQYGNDVNPRPGKFDFSNKLCDNVKIFSCKNFDPAIYKDPLKRAVTCIKKATELKMDYINYSGGGVDFSDEEYEAYRRYTESGGTVMVAAGNDGSRLSDKPYYPASYAFNSGFTSEQRSRRTKTGSRRYVPLRLHVVQNVNRDFTLASTSNSDILAIAAVGQAILSTLPDNSHGYMNGTSQATPAVLHTILKQECARLNYKK